MSTADDDKDLFSNPPDIYGPNYGQHLMEQYKMYVGMADNISERRNKANAFFLTANSFLVTTLGITAGLSSPTGIDASWLFTVAALGGIVFAVTWLLTIYSYRQINKIKFQLIRSIETKLPISPYNKEWLSVDE